MSDNGRGLAGEIDHLVLNVSDLDEAFRVYQRLGFVLSPRAEHEALGTANHVFVFSDTYCELLGVVRPAVASATVGGALAAVSGISGLALCGSADGARADYGGRGIVAGDAIEFSRDARVGDQVSTARFRISRLEEGAAPGFFAFVCEHLTPELVWHPAAMIHPNGVHGVEQVLLRADQPVSAARRFARLRPGSVTEDGGVGRVDLGPQLCLYRPSDLTARYPGLRLSGTMDGEREGRADAPNVDSESVGVVFSTTSLNAAITCLEAARIEYRHRGVDSVYVLPQRACGILVEFVEH